MTKEYVIKDLFGILVIVNVNMINHLDVGEYLDYKNCKCRKKLKVEQCSENIDRNEMIYNTTLNDKVCNSCTIHIVFLAIFKHL